MKNICTIAAILPVCLAACQTYQPAPITSSEHLEAWRNRSPESDEVTRYAKAIADANPQSGARSIDLRDGLSLQEAELLALVYNPGLRLARLKARVPVLGAELAGLWEDPVIGFDALKTAESVSNPWILGTSISFTIPISGRLEVARSRAFAEGDLEIWRAYQSEWNTLRDLRQAWIDWARAEEQLKLALGYQSDLDPLRSIAAQQAQLGQISSTDRRVFDIEFTRLEGELIRLRADARSRRQAVLAWMGFKPDADLPLHPAIIVHEIPDIEIDSAVLQHPGVQIARSEYQVAEQALHLEIRKQYPDLQIGPGYEYEDGLNEAGIVLSVPLPILNRNARAIAEAQAARHAARAAYENTVEQLIHETNDAQQHYQAAAERHTHTLTQLAPLTDRQLSDLKTQAGLGEFDALIMLTALNASREAKLTILETTAEKALASIKITSLIARPPVTPVLNDLSKEDTDVE